MHPYYSTVVIRTHYRLLLPALFSGVLIVGAAHVSFSQEEGNSESPDATARAVTINFDTLGTGITLPPNQYPSASFTSYAGGTVATAYDAGFGGSYPNGIVATSGSGINYWPTADLYINFPTPVNGLT